ncbi:cation:proton antiporter domain-containing protein [Melioribacter sp. OK-6-Me]|uniref:cation:proton antiporter domain-containing protein n=1 Tax=unclassified Melioribacter TaxID=2627329 RepID=UPI003EDA9607
MIPVLRRIIVISILFSIFLFVETIQVESTGIINPKTLAVLGFLIIASFALGEIFALIKLPRVIGYLLIGIIFGPYSHFIFDTKILQIFNNQVIHDISLVNNVTLALIALTAGLELKINAIKSFLKSSLLILLFKTITIFVLITGTVYFLSPFVPFLAGENWTLKLASGLILSVIALGTSIELTLVVANELKARGRFVDLILSTAILKDILVILLLAIVLTISASLLSISGGAESPFITLGKELLFSLLFGGVLGAAGFLYMKYINRELLLFIVAFVVFGSEIASMLHLEMLVTFVTAGFIIQNFSQYGEQIHKPLGKISLPIFITFFTIAGASLNLFSVSEAIVIGIIIVLVRALAFYLSITFATKATREPLEITKFSWMGFLSIGGLMLGLAIIISQKLPGLGNELKNLITSVVALNIFIGPVLFKIGITKAKSFSQAEEIQPAELQVEKIEKDIKPIKVKARFREPDLKHEELNKSLYNILIKVNNILSEFDKKFIQSRGEESLELLVSLTEKYSDEYQSLKKLLSDTAITHSKIRMEILKVKKNLSEWLIALCEERKKTEKRILNLEPLIRDLFYAFIDLTDGLKYEYLADLEEEKYISSPEDGTLLKLRKFLLRSKLHVNRLFNKDYKLKRRIKYRNLTKYYLVGESSQEILESVNLVGIERLTTLKILRTFYKQTNEELDQLLETALNEKDNVALPMILIEKLDEIHQQMTSSITVYTNEINATVEEIGRRLFYAVANPFNKLIDTLHIAGTYEFNERQYRFSKVFEKSENAKELALLSIRYWTIYYAGIIGLFQKEAYIDKLKVDIDVTLAESLISVSEEINKDIRETNAQLQKELKIFRKKLAEIDSLSNEELEQLFHEEKLSHFINVIQKQLKILKEVSEGKKIDFLFDHFISRFKNIAASLPETVELLEEADLVLEERIPKLQSLKSVPIRSIANTILHNKLSVDIGEINELMVNQFSLITEEVKNYLLIINFHFDTAIHELEKPESDRQLAVNLANSFYEKMSFRIDEVNKIIDRIETDINKRLTERVSASLESINDLIMKKSYGDIKSYLTKAEQKGKLLKTYNQIRDELKHLIRKYRVIIKRNYNLYFRYVINDLLVKYNIVKIERGDSDSETLFNKSKIEKLPFIYKKLFDGTPIDTYNLFVGLDQVEKTIKYIIERHKKNEKSSLLIAGETGSGKSSLLNFIINNYLKTHNIVRYEFTYTVTEERELLRILCRELGYNHTYSLNELVFLLNDKSNKRVIVLESLNELYLRKISGYDALNALRYLINSTSENTLWICTSDKYSWEFIRDNFEYTRVFEKEIMVNELHKRELRTIITTRHNATGYNLVFKPTELYKFKSKFVRPKSIEAEQKKLASLYFNRLEDFSEGNIIAAMFFWLVSIEEIKDNRVFIKVPRKIESRLLEKLEDIYLLTLFNIVLHGTLTYEEHSALFNLSLSNSKEILDYLYTKNLIDKHEWSIGSAHFFINRFFFKLIERELKKRNII